MTDDLYEFVSTFFGLVTDAASVGLQYLLNYVDYLKRILKLFAVLAAIPIPLLVIALILKWPANWLFSAYFVFVGLEAVILMALAFPIIAAAQKIAELSPTIRRTAQIIAAVAFWTLILALYFYLFPVWQNPEMVAPGLLAATALALGAYSGWVYLPKESVATVNTVALVGILMFTSFAFIFPNRARHMVGQIHKIDEETLKPNRVAVDSPDEIAFVDPTGKPQIWVYRRPDGGFDLYDREGFHPSGEKLQLVETNELRQEIRTWFREHPQQKARERKRETSFDGQSGDPDVSARDSALRVTPPRLIGSSADDEAFRQRVIQATSPGASYIGTSSYGNRLQRIRLVFTEQTNSLIRAEASNPDDLQQKQTFTGELVLKQQPEKNNPGGTYPLVMSSLGKAHEYGTDYFRHFYESNEVSGRVPLNVEN